MSSRAVSRTGSIAALALCALVGAARAQSSVSETGAMPATFGEVPDFSLQERSGRQVRRADLAGKPWIVGFAFSRCAGPCPKLMGKMAELQSRLAGADVRLVTVSVDPRNDTPGVLQDWARSFGADAERWLFLTGDPEEVRRLVRDGFKLALEGSGATLTHSTRLVLVDAQGRIAGWFDSDDDDALAKLVARARGTPSIYSRLPAVNAALNATSALLLIAGFVAIKRRALAAHKACMLSALGVSAAFLASYVVYHVEHGHTVFPGTGAAKTAYLVLLASHVLLAALVAPLAPTTALLGLTGRLPRHAAIARVTLPIWLYVSITGVAVYAVLYHIYGCSP